MTDSSQQRRVVDLVTVEVQNREHRAIANRIQKLADVPRGSQRPRFRLAVSDDSGNDEVGIIEGRAASVREHVSEFAPFMYRAWRLGRAMAADASRKRELLEELLQPDRVFALIGIGLGISALKIYRTEHSRRAVARACKENHVQVVFLDQP